MINFILLSAIRFFFRNAGQRSSGNAQLNDSFFIRIIFRELWMMFLVALTYLLGDHSHSIFDAPREAKNLLLPHLSKCLVKKKKNTY